MNVKTQQLVDWTDVIDKIDYEVRHNTCKILNGTYILHSNYMPNTIQKAYCDIGWKTMHMYVSFYAGAETFGKHKDEDDVLIAQAIGQVMYESDGHEYLLYPGYTLEIPKGIYHTPKVLTPRVTLSFSNKPKDFVEYETPEQ